ncbi:transcriptional regulator, IclR family [Epibacterium ulvae]|uniref:Transcriptional regulator, IclR family n=1 Tax=Epibacterium ulvae TaxID=1156985 RepID=A0A1G5RI89_9RHOB|nr:IclR family transcriptional regulator [Epibacterium ulvae]SCZ73588.1 transcriptional regulator, IclR family [Epibacterium ulvae]
MDKPKIAQGTTISSVDHAIKLIEVLAERGSATVSEIAQETSLPRPTIYRLLNTLAQRDITGSEQKKHHLTLRLYELAVTARSTDRLLMRAHPILERIVSATGLTAHFAVLDDDAAAFVAKKDGPGARTMASRVGWRGPLHCTAVGKALMAETRIPENLKLPKHTERTIVDFDALVSALDTIRRQGFSVDDEELLTGLRCVAVAWRDGETLLGAISVSGRTEEIGKPNETARILMELLEN